MSETKTHKKGWGPAASEPPREEQKESGSQSTDETEQARPKENAARREGYSATEAEEIGAEEIGGEESIEEEPATGEDSSGENGSGGRLYTGGEDDAPEAQAGSRWKAAAADGGESAGATDAGGAPDDEDGEEEEEEFAPPPSEDELLTRAELGDAGAGGAEDEEDFPPAVVLVAHEQSVREQGARRPEPAEAGRERERVDHRDPTARAFDPDAASTGAASREAASREVRGEATSERPGHQEEAPPEQPVSYGHYPASRIARAVRGLPFAGKLFDRNGSAPSQRTTGASTGAVEDPAPAADERGLAAKPPPEEVESRLKLALRETSIDGYRRICVGSPKGGIGKSSIAYSLAGSIAYYTNLRVCLVDSDPEFGSTRQLVPRPVDYSIVELARDGDELHKLSDLRRYVAQNERMRLDVLLNPPQMVKKAEIEDLAAAYEHIDTVLSRFYDVVVYDMGVGFSHPLTRKVLTLSDELVLVGDSEVVSNDMLTDALDYIQGLDVDLANATLTINHRLPQTDESAATGIVKDEHAPQLRRVTEVSYDAAFSQLLNRRSFHVEELSPRTRLDILTTTAACLEGLRSHGERRSERRVAVDSRERKD